MLLAFDTKRYDSIAFNTIERFQPICWLTHKYINYTYKRLKKVIGFWPTSLSALHHHWDIVLFLLSREHNKKLQLYLYNSEYKLSKIQSQNEAIIFEVHFKTNVSFTTSVYWLYKQLNVKGVAKGAQSCFDKATIRMYDKYWFSLSLRLVPYMVMLKYISHIQSLVQLNTLSLYLQVLKISLNK